MLCYVLLKGKFAVQEPGDITFNIVTFKIATANINKSHIKTDVI